MPGRAAGRNASPLKPGGGGTGRAAYRPQPINTRRGRAYTPVLPKSCTGGSG